MLNLDTTAVIHRQDDLDRIPEEDELVKSNMKMDAAGLIREATTCNRCHVNHGKVRMTGDEFKEGIKRLGLTQTRLAQILGCDRGTLIARCKMDVVDAPYRYIMLGMLAEKSACDLVLAVGSINI